jgi:hypothetical protein
MNKRAWIGLLVLMATVSAAAPPKMEWCRTYHHPGEGYSDPAAVVPVQDGGYFLTVRVGRNSQEGALLGNVWLLRTNEKGDSLWSRTYGGKFLDWPEFVIPMKDGGYVIGGHTQSYAEQNPRDTVIVNPGLQQRSADGWLLRVDANGDSLWSRTVGNADDSEQLLSYAPTADGGYIFGGCLSWYGSEYMDMGWDTDGWLVKSDSAFNIEWTRRYGGHYADVCRGVQQSGDGGYLLACWTQSFGPGGTWLLRTDARGDSLRSDFPDSTDHADAYALLPALDGGFVLAGVASYTAQSRDCWIGKITAQGDRVWSHAFGGPDFDFCGNAIAFADGYLLIGGTHSFAAESSAGWLIRTDANGDSLWSIVFDHGRMADFNAACATADEGLIAVGSTTLEPGAGSVVLLVKFSKE